MTNRANFQRTGGWPIRIALSAVLLSSCASYKPCLDAENTNPESIIREVRQGKHYSLSLTGGQKVRIKVDSVLSDKLTGDIHMRQNRKVVHKEDYMIPFSHIESVKERKFDAVLTSALVVGTVGFGALMLSGSEFTNLGGGF